MLYIMFNLYITGVLKHSLGRKVVEQLLHDHEDAFPNPDNVSQVL